MTEQITLLAKLAAVDRRLDELHDELGDLPREVKKLEANVRDKAMAVEATEAKLSEIRHLRGNAGVSKAEIGDKEAKLTEQQFQVKNNREFDAITKELEHLKDERASLEERLRTSSVTEENLGATLEAQQAELAEARDVLTAKEAELSELTGEHNVELKKFIEARLRIIAELNDALEAEYERIRTFHREAAVAIRRGSCSGCYSAIPSQRIVEMNHSGDKLHTCENCGRVLISEKLADSVEELVEDDQL